jgi:hypothetical protein
MIKLVGISILAVLLVVSVASLHTTDAVTYEKQEDSKYVKQKIVEPLKGKNGWWKYLLKVCADDRNLGIAEIVLSSDMETIYQGVNKGLAKGNCTYFGAVMKAKNGNTLGYKITQIHEAVDKIVESKQQKLSSSSWSEIMRYKFILGFY